MADKKAMTALFKMCTELKKEVETLRAEVKELRDARTAPEKILESMNHLSEDIINTGDYAEKEIIRLDTDLSEIRKNVEASEKCRRTTIQKIRALETSVYRGQASSRRQRPERDQQRQGQFRKPWVRVCYNCRKPGHIAMCCPKPNPRNEILSASPKPTLSGILKRKLPEANSVHANTEPEAQQLREKHDRPSLCERPASEALAVVSKPMPEWEIEWRAGIAAKKAKVQDMMAAVAIAEQQKKNGKVSSLRQHITPYGSEASMDICDDW